VQRDLLGPGLVDRPDLGAQQVGTQKIVCDGEPPLRIAFEQMKPGIAPEIVRNGYFSRSSRT
jgi:hypothetical protein